MGADGQGGEVPAEQVVRVVVRPIATPLSLGFLGLAGATFCVSGLELGWIPSSQKPMVGLVLLGFTALPQLVAAVYGFLARDAVAATGMGVLTGTWLATGLVLHLSPPSEPTSGAIGLLLIASGTALLAPALAALRSKVLAALVLLTTSTRFFVTGGYELSGSHAWKPVSGYIGLVLFGLAVLAAAAFELEDTRRRPLPLTMRRNRGRAAMAADWVDELEGVRHEAGVREQL